MNYERLASQLLRALRGRRSQTAFCRRIGQRSNVAHAWETGVGFPSASKAFFVASRLGVDPNRAVRECFKQLGASFEQIDVRQKAGVARLLSELRGSQTISSLSASLGSDRFCVSRWLNGKTEPKLPELLRYIEVATLRLLDFVSYLTDPMGLGEVREAWQRLETARRATREAPYCHAVLAALDLKAYRALPSHRRGFVAGQLGLTLDQEDRALELLAGTGQIRRARKLWVPIRTHTVDTRSDPEGARSLAVYCAEQGLARLRSHAEGAFAYNLFSVSSADLERLRQLQRDYFAELRRIVAASQDTEQVVIVNLQLLPLSPIPDREALVLATSSGRVAIPNDSHGESNRQS